MQVVGKGSFFSARANKLYQLYQRYGSLGEIDEPTQRQVQDQFFGKSFEEVWRETRDYFLRVQPEEVTKAERHPKHKMALVFKWYYVHTGRAAMKGDPHQKYDYQIHCGPALGSFNQWVRGTDLEHWRNRHVDHIGCRLMEATAPGVKRKNKKIFRSLMQSRAMTSFPYKQNGNGPEMEYQTVFLSLNRWVPLHPFF